MKPATSFLLFLTTLVVFTPVNASIADDSAPINLTIGQITQRSSLPLNAINERMKLPVRLVAAQSTRTESFPSLDPLPKTANELPDIVGAMVAYKHNELVALARGNLIVPLDGFYADAGMDPKTFFPESVYAAISFDGHIWAVPHRVQAFLLSYDQDVFDKLGLKPGFGSWQELRMAAEAIGSSTNSKSRGFTEGEVPIIDAMALLMDFVERPGIDPQGIQATQEFFGQCAAGGSFSAPIWENEMAIRLENFATLEPGRHVVAAPSTASIQNVGQVPPLGFMECFALRLNSGERLAAAQSFLRWLMGPDTQLWLVERTRLDVPSGRMGCVCRHVPLYTPVLESEEYKRLCAQIPAYCEFKKLVSNVRLTTAAQSIESEELQSSYRQLYDYTYATTEIKKTLADFESFIGMIQTMQTQSPASETGKNVSVDQY